MVIIASTARGPSYIIYMLHYSIILCLRFVVTLQVMFMVREALLRVFTIISESHYRYIGDCTY